MATVTLASLFNTLKELMVVPAGSSDRNLSDPLLKRFLCAAAVRHNPVYTLTEDTSAVPAAEEQPVLLLAWHDAMLVRASGFAAQANTTAPNGFGMDRSTPYHKCVDLAERLAKQYVKVCESLGLAQHAFSAKVSQTLVSDPLTGVVTPTYAGPLVQPVSLHTINFVSGTHIEVLWDAPPVQSDLLIWSLFHRTGTTPLRDDAQSEGLFPGVALGFGYVWQSANQDLRAVRLSLPHSTGEIHRFLMAATGRNYRVAYSNELYRQYT